MHCTKCGQENADGARLCQRCGFVIGRKEVKGTKGEDVLGFVLGGILLLPLIWQIWWFGKTLWTDHQPLGPYCAFLLGSTSLTGMVTLVAACLFIPARHYEKAPIQRIGLIGASVSAALCVAAIGALLTCGVLQVLALTEKNADADLLFLPLVLMVPAAIAVTLFMSSTFVMIKKTGFRLSRVALGAFVVLLLGGICVAIGWYAST